MAGDYIDRCCREVAGVLAPSGYLLLWTDTFHLCEGDHRRIADVLKCVAWDNLRAGMGYRTRRRGDYLLVLQKEPLRARATWREHGIPSRWHEKVDRKTHPHAKPVIADLARLRPVLRPPLARFPRERGLTPAGRRHFRVPCGFQRRSHAGWPVAHLKKEPRS
jgi:site-specific DNA-methyltransferase (adenine-specific)